MGSPFPLGISGWLQAEAAGQTTGLEIPEAAIEDGSRLSVNYTHSRDQPEVQHLQCSSLACG